MPPLRFSKQSDKNNNLLQTFAIELRAQADILKSVYVGVLPDPAKPTVFNLTDIIGCYCPKLFVILLYP